MIYREEKRDLFSVPYDYALCHCVSADFKMGTGIAKKFAELGIKKRLLWYLSNKPYPSGTGWNNKGYSLSTTFPNNEYKQCINLVTKEFYYGKPTLETMRNALICARDRIIEDREMNVTDIQYIAMPKIGCGLDKLKWGDVSEIIKDVFKDVDIAILVCYL